MVINREDRVQLTSIAVNTQDLLLNLQIFNLTAEAACWLRFVNYGLE